MEEKIKLALIGYPLGHSLSPILHNCAFEELSINGSYELLPTKSEDLINQIKNLKRNKYFGFNVTIPHKVPVSLFLSKYDENVNITGSVNTVKIEEDMSLSGFNTDVSGFYKALPKDVDLKGKKAAVIGTGGASRAICAGLFKAGISEIDIYARNLINSKETIETLRNRFDKIKIQAMQLSLMEHLEDVNIVVNTTPLGMRNYNEEGSPLNDEQVESLPSDAIVYDIVYNPLKTILISKAIRYNKKYVLGIDMLIHQAIDAFEIWTGEKPDFKTLKIKVLEEFLINKF